MFHPARRLLAAGLLVVCLAACGSSSGSGAHTSAGAQSSSASSPATSSSTPAGPNPLSAEVKSAAAGDIPDTQVYLSYRDPAAGFSISYPEGWTRQGGTDQVRFSDKNNIVRIVIAKGASPTPASVAAELTRLRQTNPSLTFTSPRTVTLKSGPAIKATYTTRSAPNPVTGKTVVLVVDRYVLSHGGKFAILDLGAPKGVDNVDAYRMLSNSFRWL
jgi:hypothetical protein